MPDLKLKPFSTKYVIEVHGADMMAFKLAESDWVLSGRASQSLDEQLPKQIDGVRTINSFSAHILIEILAKNDSQETRDRVVALVSDHLRKCRHWLAHVEGFEPETQVPAEIEQQIDNYIQQRFNAGRHHARAGA